MTAHLLLALALRAHGAGSVPPPPPAAAETPAVQSSAPMEPADSRASAPAAESRQGPFPGPEAEVSTAAATGAAPEVPPSTGAASVDVPPSGSEDPVYEEGDGPEPDGEAETEPEEAFSSTPIGPAPAAPPDEFAPSFIDSAAAARVPAPLRPVLPPADRKTRKTGPVQEDPVEPVSLPPGFVPIRGVHLSAWVAGAPGSRRKFLDRAKGTFINAVVVPLKETDGHVYIPGVPKAQAYGTYLGALPDPKGLVDDIHARGLKAIARVVIFKDNVLARKRPDLAVKRPDGQPWRNRKGVTWVDPYRKEIWDYALEIAAAAARAGFDEIQWDYIRFPSDGDVRQCRYSRGDHSKQLAHETVQAFLRYSREKLGPLPFSVAVFGMTTSTHADMGIGQDIRAMGVLSDSISPMMYPSHYARGEYGLAHPNREPYKVIHRGLRDAKKRLGLASSWKLRPYLQDFSMGHRYGPLEVEAQLLAAQKQGIDSFILWNPGNQYTWRALEVRNDARVKYPAAGAPPAKIQD